MSLNLNQVTIAGHLTRDPQVKTLQSGNMVANFGVAINRRWKTESGETREAVTFVDCSAWGKTAENIGHFLAKGDPLCVVGHLHLESWDDKDGQKRSKLVVVADRIHFLGQRRDGAKAPTPTPAAGAPVGARSDDEPPF